MWTINQFNYDRFSDLSFLNLKGSKKQEQSVDFSNTLATTQQSTQVNLEDRRIEVYNYVTHHLNSYNLKSNPEKAKKAQAILDKSFQLSNSEEIGFRIINAANAHHWNELKEIKDYLFYALANLKHEMPIETFTTITFFWSISQKHSTIQSIPLFHEKEINPEAKELIQQTLMPTKDGLITNKYQLNRPYLENLEPFFQLMQKMPLSEQQFFLVPTNQSTTKGFSEEWEEVLAKKQTMTEAIKISNSINIFLHVTKNGQHMRMVPSFGMMQALVDIIGGKNRIKILPIIDVSSQEAIRQNGLTDTRDMALPFEGIDLPKEADGVVIEEDIDFPFHDFYHALILALIEKSHRKAGIKLEEIVQLLKSSYEDGKIQEFLENLAERLIDMEYITYRPELYTTHIKTINTQSKISMIFWINLQTLVANSHIRLALKHANGDSDNLKLHLEYTNLMAAQNEIYVHLFKQIFDHKKEFSQHYGIKFKPLFELGKQAKSTIKKRMENLEQIADPQIYKTICRSAYQSNLLVQGYQAYKDYLKQKKSLTNQT